MATNIADIWHEAGHALAAFAHGLPIEVVTLQPPEVWLKGPLPNGRPQAALDFFMAGSLGESLFAHSCGFCAVDYCESVAWAGKLPGRDSELIRACKRDVAAGQIAHAGQFLAAYGDNARRLLLVHLDALKVLALNLQAKGALSGAEVRQIVLSLPIKEGKR